MRGFSLSQLLVVIAIIATQETVSDA